MTIEEAIVNHKKLKVSAEINNNMRGAFYNAEEHEQLAAWLEELNRRRVEELFRKMDEKSIRNKAIDDLKNKFTQSVKENYFFSGEFYKWALQTIEQDAEQLKAGGEND